MRGIAVLPGTLIRPFGTPEPLLGPDDYRGGLRFFPGSPTYAATATALEPSIVIRISRSLFLKILEGYPEAAVQLREQIRQRAERSLSDMGNVRALLDTSDAPR